MKNAITVQAKSIDLALKNAAQTLNTDKENLEYELISKTDAGFLSFLGGRKVELKVWSKKTKSTRSRKPNQQSRTAAHTPNLEPLSASETNDLVEDIRQFCEGICKFLTSSESVKVSTVVEDGRLKLNIHDDEIATTISKNARLAESMEHLLRKKPRYLKRELPFRIFVDANNIRSTREQELVEMAHDLSSQVSENQKPIVLNYKSSYDRKIIHMTLDQDDKVYTKSIGTGTNRKLMILPAKETGLEREPQPVS